MTTSRAQAGAEARGRARWAVPTALAMVLVALVPVAGAARPQRVPDSGATPAQLATAAADYGRLPVSFVPNRGQADPAVRFTTRAGGASVFLTATEAVVVPRTRTGAEAAPSAAADADHRVRLSLVGARRDPKVVGEGRLPGRVSYFRGADPARWQTGLPTYARVTSKGVYPGIDLTWYGKGTDLEYDFVVAPGADPSRIAVEISGAQGLRLDGGELVADTAAGELRQRRPVIYQSVSGKRRAVSGAFVLRDQSTVGFALGPYDRSRPLVIDPTLVYSTYLGGAGGGEEGMGISVDGSGAAYVVGATDSAEFSASSSRRAAWDAFVAKLDPTGSSLVYAAFIGGDAYEQAYNVAVDANGAAHVVGTTRSTNFPTTPGAFDTTLRRSSIICGLTQDAFVAKLDPSGSRLSYGTYLGGDCPELQVNEDAGIAVGPGGLIYLTGAVSGSDFPTTPGAFDSVHGSAGYPRTDAFVSVLDPSVAGDGSGQVSATNQALRYSTFLGGSNYENFAPRSMAGDIAVDGAGLAYVTGGTFSADFPTTPGAFDRTFNPEETRIDVEGPSEAFVSVLDPSVAGDGSGQVSAINQALRYSTFLGGGKRPPQDYGGDGGTAIAVRNGIIYLAGWADTVDFPVTPGAFQTAPPGCAHGCDGFVAKLDPARLGDGSGVISAQNNPALLYSSYFGTPGVADRIHDMALDGKGHLWVVGSTPSTNLPRKQPIYSNCGCFYSASDDAFVARFKLDPTDSDPVHPTDPDDTVDDSTDLLFSTYLGGTGNEFANGIAIGPRNNAYVTGFTNSPRSVTLSDGSVVSKPFPTTLGAFQPSAMGAPSDANYRADAFVSRIDPAMPQLKLSDASVTEGNAGTTTLSFTLSLSGITGKKVAVAYATANGTASAPSDYEATSGKVTFAPGEQRKAVSVKVNGDQLAEANETLVVKLSSPVGATVADGKGVGTIVNDD